MDRLPDTDHDIVAWFGPPMQKPADAGVVSYGVHHVSTTNGPGRLSDGGFRIPTLDGTGAGALVG
jgi:hypothetical protein